MEHLHDAHTQPLVKWNTLQYSHKTFGYVECISDASNETPVMCFEWNSEIDVTINIHHHLSRSADLQDVLV